MPALSVFVDSKLQACVRTEDLHVLTVSIGGAKTDDALATIEFAGGRYPKEGESTNLTWLSEFEVVAGQHVRVTVASEGTTTQAGKTFEELFPDEPKKEKHGPMPSRQHLIDEVRQCKHLRERMSGVVRSSSGTEVVFATTPQDHAFCATFLWNWLRPDRVSASLHTYTLDQLASGQELTYLFREHMIPDAWVEVTIDA